MNYLPYILIAIVVIIVLYIIGAYNSLVTLKNRVANSFAQMDVQMKKRFDLVPNLVETVKGYAAHEKEIFTKISEARNAISTSANLDERKAGENMLTQGLRQLFAVAEAYPNLKANENFISLQKELSDIESKIAFSRQFYNDVVMKLNTKIQYFPSNIVASMFHFQEAKYFEIDQAERENVKVKF